MLSDDTCECDWMKREMVSFDTSQCMLFWDWKQITWYIIVTWEPNLGFGLFKCLNCGVNEGILVNHIDWLLWDVFSIFECVSICLGT